MNKTFDDYADMRDYYKTFKLDQDGNPRLMCKVGSLQCGGMFDPGMDCRVCRIPVTAKMEELVKSQFGVDD